MPKKISLHEKLMTAAYEKYGAKDTETKFVAKLPLLERYAVVLGNLNYQVENGGFAQWIDNRYVNNKDVLFEALKALNTVTAKLVSTLVTEVLALHAKLSRRPADDDGLSYESHDKHYYMLQAQLLKDTETYLQAAQKNVQKDVVKKAYARAKATNCPKSWSA